MQKRKSSLSETDIKNMLKLEQLFHSKYLTEQLLNELTSLYVKAIDCVNDKALLFKKYFLQKMQFVLSCPQINRLLEGNQFENMETENSLELQKYQYSSPTFPLAQKKNKQASFIQNHLGKDEQIKTLNQKIQIQIKLMKEYQSQMKNFQSEMTKMNQISRRFDSIIQSQSKRCDSNAIKIKRKLRKKSADLKEIQLMKDELQINLKPITKDDLLRGQAEIQDKLVRFTFNTNNKNSKIGILVSNLPSVDEYKKARIKKSRIIEDEEDDDWGFASKQKQTQSGIQNRSSRAITVKQNNKNQKFDQKCQSLQQIVLDRRWSSYPQINQKKIQQKQQKKKSQIQPQFVASTQVKQVIEVYDNQLVEDDYF